MKMHHRIKFIAITGGSGAGKTWLAGRLQRALGAAACRLSLDNFYLDRSSLPPAERERINFDHPDSIDWLRFEEVLADCRSGRPTRMPCYHFATHTRRPFCENFTPAPLVLVDGLWLLWQPRIHELFDLKIYLDCPAPLRLERRLARDAAERGRSDDSVRAQFWNHVAPMHDQFVAPQAEWANLIFQAPLGDNSLRQLIEMLEGELLRVALPGTKPPDETMAFPAPARRTDQAAEVGFDIPDFVLSATARNVKETDSRGGLIQPDLT
ncbi:MAG TPA: uridine kinase [Verrucomicrobiae bacterium]|nr:uridine kinase [Verrucomicrobiae bacterium]